MSKVITFSTKFPSNHKRSGESTNFVPKIWRSLKDLGTKNVIDYIKSSMDLVFSESEAFGLIDDFKPKKHTIRTGKRWKSGDCFSPRIWSGKPYCSKQIIIAPDIKIVRVVSFKMSISRMIYVDGIETPQSIIDEIATNDGLSYTDFIDWFKCHSKKSKESNILFEGQILIWHDNNLNY